MAAKAKAVYLCSACGFETPRWFGKCPECGEWNTLSEHVVQTLTRTSGKSAPSPKIMESKVSTLSSIEDTAEIRRDTGLVELDRVLGGGIVDGSVVLLSGDPGIGKSTLLLQICDTLCRSQKVLYVAGEESPRQIKMRAARLGVDSENLYIAAITDIEDVIHTIHQVKPGVVMVDSIQTMHHAALTSSTGSIVQVRECSQLLMNTAKDSEIPIFLVGHVNKDGGIAGPKVLEHMVDVVLYFEGERQSSYRILRAIKNRFGSTNEIGVFEMDENGLVDVENPSMMLLSGRPQNVSGTCVACVMEGTRPILAEVQALVSKTSFGTPRRVATGFDFNRAALLIAILEKRGGYFFGNLDAYINIIGGLRLDEPAADLPVAISLISNLLDKPVGDDVVAIGEVGLAGELRSVSHIQARINECVRLGFHTILLPKPSLKSMSRADFEGVEIKAVSTVQEAFSVFR
ncbi:MAG: DNA repair protein RadA [Oscillospiraceae bacterium]